MIEDASGKRVSALRRKALRIAAVATLAMGATPLLAQGACTREGLKTVADRYIQAQTAGDPTRIPFTLWVQYTEQMDPSASLSSGIISQPLKIDFSRSLLDTQSCSTFTEAVVTDPAHPYVIAVAMQARGSEVNTVDTLVTDKDDWLFNAANTLRYSKAENWGEIPAADRDSRQTLIAAANAYLDYFDNKSVQVPWGTPCARLEGGLYTGKGAPGVATPEDSCNVGVPNGVKLIERRYIVDETLGAVAVMLSFGTNKLPDVHTFRIEKGKIRYVHTITVCKTFNCGFKVPDALQTKSE